jgi:hypothetical protein
MDLRAYYLTIRRIEAELKEDSVVIVSLETSDVGKAGTRTEVPRPLAARLIVDGKAALASPEDAAEFRAMVEEKWKAAHGFRAPQKKS